MVDHLALHPFAFRRARDAHCLKACVQIFLSTACRVQAVYRLGENENKRRRDSKNRKKIKCTNLVGQGLRSQTAVGVIPNHDNDRCRASLCGPPPLKRFSGTIPVNRLFFCPGQPQETTVTRKFDIEFRYSPVGYSNPRTGKQSLCGTLGRNTRTMDSITASTVWSGST